MPDASRWIAVVEDDPSVLNALRRTLRIRGFQTKTYASARDFLAALPGGLPECLILDLHMPQMSGLELLQYLAHRDIQIPTIIITSHGDIRVQERAESANVIAVLLKPLENALLFAAIDEASRAARSSRGRPS